MLRAQELSPRERGSNELSLTPCRSKPSPRREGRVRGREALRCEHSPLATTRLLHQLLSLRRIETQ